MSFRKPVAVRVGLALSLLALLASPLAAQFVPPPCSTDPFLDVQPANPFCPWIRQLELDHIVTADGCGGGNYCPDNPVTRQQLAMLLGKAVHGTDTFKIGRYARVATLALGGTGDYSSIAAALAALGSWCGVPAYGNTCLLRLMPGTYTLSSTLDLPEYLDVEGSGMQRSWIQFIGPQTEGIPAVTAAGEGEIRDLTIWSSGAANNRGVLLENSRRVLRRVDVYVSGSQSEVGIMVSSGESGSYPVLDSCAIRTDPGATSFATGLTASSEGSAPTIRNSGIAVYGAAGAACRAIELLDDADALVEESSLHVGCPGSAVQVEAGGVATIQGGTIRVFPGAGVGEGVNLEDEAFAELDGVFIDGSGTVTAVRNEAATPVPAFNVLISNSDLIGETAVSTGEDGWTRIERSNLQTPVSAVAGGTVWIAASRLDGGVTGAGTFKCVGAYDSNFDPLTDACLPPP